MKKLTYLFLITFLIIGSSFKTHNEVKWVDFKTGYETSLKKKKMMLVDVYTDWCGWCKVMDRETYAKPDVANLINANFIPIKFNPEVKGVEYTYEGKKYSGADLQGVISQYQLRGYPATVFIDPTTKKVALISGYKNAVEFTSILNSMKDGIK
jgi:uncharacterized protein YyaL (SSP411 family)